MASKKHLLFKLGAIFLSLLLLALVDFSLRFIFPELKEEMDHLRVLASDETDRCHSVIKEPDPYLLWHLKPDSPLLPHEKLNHLGFRGHEFDHRKPQGSYRIVCIGDSRTFGFGVNFWQDLFPYQVEKQLKKDFPDKTGDVLNMAVIGYTSFQGLRLLKSQVLSFHPDILIIWFGFNDTLFFHKTDVESASQSRLISSLQFFLNKSAVYNLIRKIHHRIKNSVTQPIQIGQPIVRRVPLNQYRNNLSQMIRICKTNHITPILLTSPLRPDIPLVLNSKLIKFQGDDGLWYERLQFQYNLDGFWLMDADHFPGSEIQLNNLLTKYPELPILHYFKAQFLKEAGKLSDADEEMRLAHRLDTEREIIADYNRSTIEIAESTHVTYLDLAEIFSNLKQTPKTYFVDECHPNKAGHDVIYNALFPVVRLMVQNQ